MQYQPFRAKKPKPAHKKGKLDESNLLSEPSSLSPQKVSMTFMVQKKSPGGFDNDDSTASKRNLLFGANRSQDKLMEKPQL
jgi:hypothetical protein